MANLPETDSKTTTIAKKNGKSTTTAKRSETDAGKRSREEMDGRYLIRAALNALEALDLFTTDKSSLCVSELQQALGVNANMAFRILYTLETAKYIVYNPETGKYHLSLKVFTMGKVAAASISINRFALPYMRLLSTEYPKLNVVLLVYEHGDLIVTERISSNWLPKVYAHVGRTQPLHATASGKIFLSQLDDAELEVVVREKGLESFTASTITDYDTLKKELEEIRTSGIAWEREEHILGLNGFASAIRDKNDNVIAALCMSGFNNYVSIKELEEVMGKLLDATLRISETMRFTR